MSKQQNTEQQTALAVRRPVTPQAWEMITALAPAVYRSRLFGVKSAEQAMTIMLKGHELGLNPTASFEFIDVINGKPSLKPRGMLALLHDHPECAEIKVEDIPESKGQPQACRVYMKRRNGFEYTVTFSMEDAKRAGLLKDSSGWAKYPANMLRWRALGFCADIVFPDILGGLKRADELGADLTEDGDVIEGSWTVSQPEGDKRAGATVEPGYTELLSEMMEQYGPDAIMEAAGGTLPATLRHLSAVAIALEVGVNGDEWEEEE